MKPKTFYLMISMLLMSISFIASPSIHTKKSKETSCFVIEKDHDLASSNFKIAEEPSSVNEIKSAPASKDSVSDIVIKYSKLESVAEKHLNYKGSNYIIAIFFPDSYCIKNQDTTLRNLNFSKANLTIPIEIKKGCFDLAKEKDRSFRKYIKSFADKPKPLTLFC